MYYGWISVENYEDKNILQSLGIIVGWYSESVKLFGDCQVPSKALKTLDQYWGKFYWGLDKVSDEMAR